MPPEIEARLGVSCVGVFSPLDRTYLDVRIFHAGAPSYRSKTPNQLYAEHERQKKREYNARILNIEKSTFVHMVFYTSGGIGKEATRFLKQVAGIISNRRGEEYSDVNFHLKTRPRIALLKSTLIAKET